MAQIPVIMPTRLLHEQAEQDVEKAVELGIDPDILRAQVEDVKQYPD